MKSLIKTGLLVVFVAALTGVVVYEYQNRPVTTPQKTVSWKQYSDLQSTLLTHDATSKVKTDQLTAQVKQDDLDKAALCAQLAKFKATSPVCTQ